MTATEELLNGGRVTQEELIGLLVACYEEYEEENSLPAPYKKTIIELIATLRVELRGRFNKKVIRDKTNNKFLIQELPPPVVEYEHIVTY